MVYRYEILEFRALRTSDAFSMAAICIQRNCRSSLMQLRTARLDPEIILRLVLVCGKKELTSIRLFPHPKIGGTRVRFH